MDAFIFYLSAAISLVASAIVATRKNPVYGALFLVIFFPAFSVNFLILRASFLAVIQVLVYAGAIMVLYLFVIMLLSLTRDQLQENVTGRRRALAAAFSLGLFLVLAQAIHSSPRVRAAPDLVGPVSAEGGAVGTTEAMGMEFFQKQILPFELTSVMILVAIIGAIYLTKRRGMPRPEEPEGTGAPAGAGRPGAEPRPAVPAAGGPR